MLVKSETRGIERLLEKFVAEEQWVIMCADTESCVYRTAIVHHTIHMTLVVSIVRGKQAVLSCEPQYFFLGRERELDQLVSRIEERLQGAECEFAEEHSVVFHFDASSVVAKDDIGIEVLFDAFVEMALEMTHKYFCAFMLVYWGKESAAAALEEIDKQEA